jgi:hypothetical protein
MVKSSLPMEKAKTRRLAAAVAAAFYMWSVVLL